MDFKGAGICAKKYVNIESSSEVIVIKKNFKFNLNSIQYYKNTFQDLKEDADIVDGEFGDNKWILAKDYGYCTLTFNFKSIPEINNALKCYALLKLGIRYLTASSVQSALKAIQNHLKKTNCFSKECLVDYRESISKWTDYEKQQLYFIGEFIRYYNINASDDYYAFISNSCIPPTKVRQLPSYRSIIMFDEIITNYINSSTIRQHEKFFPLILWWKITQIIPMRPIEFSILSRDCCTYDKDTNSYFLEVVRKKQRNGIVKYKKIPILNKIKITKEIYDLITEYADLVDPNHNSKTLLSYNSYNSFLSNYIKGSAYSNKINPAILTVTDLRRLLLKFYDEVIEKAYNLTVVSKGNFSQEIDKCEIEKIQLGDTRHLAFCSMMLQGLNPLTIAQIGGHNTLREQMSYYSHLDSFIDAHTFLLSRSIKNKLNERSASFSFYRNYRNQKLEKEELGDTFYKLRKVEGGRCTSINFPYDCTELDHCIFCNYFRMDNTLNIDVIQQISLRVKKEIAAKLECIKNITHNMPMYLEREEYDLQAQTRLSTESNSLNTLVNRASILEAYKMILKED